MFLLLVVLASSCGRNSESETHVGRLLGLNFEHRNLVEYKGSGGPQVTLLVTGGHPQGALAEEGLKVFYRSDADSFQSLPMKSSASGRRFIAEIPHQESGTKVQYYIELTHRQGKRITLPEGADSGEYYTIRIE
jgi:hypothetical protein